MGCDEPGISMIREAKQRGSMKGQIANSHLVNEAAACASPAKQLHYTNAIDGARGLCLGALHGTARSPSSSGGNCEWWGVGTCGLYTASPEWRAGPQLRQFESQMSGQ